MEAKKEFKFSGITEDFKNAFKALLKEFNVTPAPVTPAVTPAATAAPLVKFGEAETKDGTKIRWEGDMPLMVGSAITVIDPANPEGFLPAPVGELELKDGTKLTIEKGLVSVLVPVTPPAVTPPPAMPDMAAQMAEVKAEFAIQFAAVTKEKTDLETKLNAEIEFNKKQIEGLTKTVKDVFELFAKAMDLPTAEPIEVPTKKVRKGIFEN